ncbi:thermonuclease family protein [Shewanella canadensis]|uniref:thermonuclease family protein n=1 Tax=Shewanella canadensis TaxID=271096 RepID=UPI001FE35A4E|nr:thermonuclease family protein [Shewanella canadensis]
MMVIHFPSILPITPLVIGENIPVRVNAIDTPEIRGKCEYEKQLAKQAKNYTKQTLAKGKEIEIRNIKRDNYLRLVADVFLMGRILGSI